MLLLSESDLRAVLAMNEVIEAVEAGFLSIARGQALIPERLKLDLPSRNAVLLEMPAYADLNGTSTLGTKLVSVFEKNSERGLPSVQALYVLLDCETGEPLSVMDGRFITGIRTAATSAVATKFMSTTGSKRLAIYGAGVQAQFHIQAMFEVADITQVTIVSRGLDKSHALADRIEEEFGVAGEIAEADHAASNSNLICTCTSSAVPLFQGKLLKPGTHINAVGAFTPATRELDSEALQRSRVIIDAEAAAGQEAGEVLIPLSNGEIDPKHIKGTLADVVSGKIQGRTRESEITLFKSCGLAIEDLVTARLAYERALANGKGSSFSI